MKFHFDNITISGGAAVGKTTLFLNLKPYLEPLNWKFKTIGEIFREHVKDNVMPLGTKASDEFNRSIENSVEKLLSQEKNWVISAWLSGFVAKDLQNTLRVLLICNNTSLRVDRVANRDKITVEQAKKFIKEREEENFTLYRRLYGQHDFLDPKYFHLVIDTYSSGQQETVDRVLDALGYKNSR